MALRFTLHLVKRRCWHLFHGKPFHKTNSSALLNNSSWQSFALLFTLSKLSEVTGSFAGHASVFNHATIKVDYYGHLSYTSLYIQSNVGFCLCSFRSHTSLCTLSQQIRHAVYADLYWLGVFLLSKIVLNFISLEDYKHWFASFDFCIGC